MLAGFIYFVTADHPDFPIKIGFMEKKNDLRMRGLQTGCPYPLILLGTVTGTYQGERALHRQFGQHRLNGEWFQRTPELLAYIESAKDSTSEQAA